MIRSLSRVFKQVGKFPTYIRLLLLRCPFDAALTTANACFLQHSFEAISQGCEVKLRYGCVYFAIASLLLFLYNGSIWCLYARFATNFTGKLRKMVFYSIVHMPFKKFDEKTSGEWMTRLNSDAQMTINLLNAPFNIPHAVVSVVNILVSALLLLRINLTLMVVTLLFVFPHVVVNRKLVYTKVTKLMEQSQEYAERNLTCFSTLITCADIVRLYDAKDFVMNAYEQSSIEMVRANMRIHIKKAINSLVIPLFGMSGYIVILLLGLIMIRRSLLTFGTLTAALQYRGAILMGTMLFINSMTEIRMNTVGLRRMEETYGGREGN